MESPAERMRKMRVRRRIAKQVAALDPDCERAVLGWIEAAAIFDDDEAR